MAGVEPLPPPHAGTAYRDVRRSVRDRREGPAPIPVARPPAGPKSGRPRRSNFNRIWKRAVRDAGANPALHLHDLKHTGGTLAAQTGATLKELMTGLGHSTPRAALIYQHTTSERDKKIADALNLMIEGRLIVPPAADPDGPSGALIPA
ncbi:tyrosine-type recombinase/integrase [Actinomadura xylanilytica]|uniref:tyrosine-type recombinase/integrase n=1 Tax=Actinomadura xylanilytica TaxID=887459 RepID=UPI00255B0AEF|nr:tyrosine-type recombinase/integrase [Actinomadura xylanilytica]MDL4777718.1 tyrosine-type recombinase/integrase [Actinomadura xylanilytica]